MRHPWSLTLVSLLGFSCAAPIDAHVDTDKAASEPWRAWVDQNPNVEFDVLIRNFPGLCVPKKSDRCEPAVRLLHGEAVGPTQDGRAFDKHNVIGESEPASSVGQGQMHLWENEPFARLTTSQLMSFHRHRGSFALRAINKSDNDDVLTTYPLTMFWNEMTLRRDVAHDASEATVLLRAAQPHEVRVSTVCKESFDIQVEAPDGTATAAEATREGSSLMIHAGDTVQLMGLEGPVQFWRVWPWTREIVVGSQHCQRKIAQFAITGIVAPDVHPYVEVTMHLEGRTFTTSTGWDYAADALVLPGLEVGFVSSELQALDFRIMDSNWRADSIVVSCDRYRNTDNELAGGDTGADVTGRVACRNGVSLSFVVAAEH